ncbi:MAG: ABC transporter permease, partial [Planctomycetales bacterium]|nr:ABC transporter permease [Planctomycetales bacterium]
MNVWTFAWRSFVHSWRVNLALILGAAIATAVITGALIVGDSVRGSLLDLAIERLGRVDEIVLADRFFRQELASTVEASTQFKTNFNAAVPAILLPNVSAEHLSSDTTVRASAVTLLGCDEKFWQQDPSGLFDSDALSSDSVIVNQPLADELNVAVGDTITLRLPKTQNVAADSTLADKTNISETLAGLKIVQIVPASGLGRFSLNPSQHLPLCAFVTLATAQNAVDQSGQVNAILACSDRVNTAPPEDAHAGLVEVFRPTLTDAGLTLKSVELQYLDESNDSMKTVHQYISLSTDRMMFVPAAADAIEKNIAGSTFQPVFTYLANSIARTDGTVNIPYSTITAIDSDDSIGPLFDSSGQLVRLSDDEIALNQWAADDLAVSVGDSVNVSYFDPETTHGKADEHTQAFRVAAIVPLVKPLLPYKRRTAARYVDPPAWTNDPDLTPTVPGVTDQESIDDWDPPFPFDHSRILARKPKDDDYWESYRTTPKAFVSNATGRKLWGSRFGEVTTYRIAGDTTSLSTLSAQIEAAITESLSSFGFQIIESKRLGIEAAKGTTPFNVLFLSFSFFIMTAAVLLVALLFRLSIEQRATENGLLLAVGVDMTSTAKLILREGFCLSCVAALMGIVIGIAYGGLMITGLKTWWVDAVVTPFLELHVSPVSLIIGGLLGITTTCLTIVFTLWRLKNVSVRQLLSGTVVDQWEQLAKRGTKRSLIVVAIVLVVAIACGVLGAGLSGEAQAGAFFGTGASILVAGLLLVRNWLRTPKSHERRFSDSLLAIKNAAQNPTRSIMTIGLMASACFLIIAISAFRLAPSDEGTGGFTLVATSELPIFDDLNDSSKRQAIFGQKSQQLDGTKIISLRLRGGEDASCRNLFQTQRPRIIGVTPALIDHFSLGDATAFKFAGSESKSANGWEVVSKGTPEDEPIPVVLDKNTAMYSQHLYGGIGEEFEREYEDGLTIKFRVAGLLSNSVLQGSFLISEADLRRLFPNEAGYRYFLIHTDDPTNVGTLLSDTFQNEGFTPQSSKAILRDLLAVQNTYLSTFQSLGGLGLLLGTFGLMAVQLRNVWQRRSELALLRATGLDRARVGRLILIEHAFLLFSGLGIGAVSALLT